MTAFQRGRIAGQLLLAPSLNLYAEGTTQNADWERGWREASAKEIAVRDANRRRGLMAAEACTELGT